MAAVRQTIRESFSAIEHNTSVAEALQLVPVVFTNPFTGTP